jgi:hypothetical protein
VLVLNMRDPIHSTLNALVHSPSMENMEVKLSSQISGFPPESFRIEAVSRTPNAKRETRNAKRGTPCSRKFINL